MTQSRSILDIDPETEAERISEFIKNTMIRYHRDGFVVGLSGGIDSALVSELCVRAVGADRVKGLILPEKESNPVSREYAEKHALKLGIDYEVADITNTLLGFGTYDLRDEIIKGIFPDYSQDRHRIKISLPPDLLNRNSFNVFSLSIMDPDGNEKTSRLNKAGLYGIMAATDTKQRTRMMHLYYHAEKMGRLVCGTTNRTETIQGFYVKFGDGGVDLEPIAHLYKTQVYQLAGHLGVIEEIIRREPSPDTYNSYVGDEEFYFRIPYDLLDILLYSWENKLPIDEVTGLTGLDNDQIMRAYRDFESKFRSTEHLRELPPSLME
ncbi:MAG: NAD(+) synthase [Thermoplasmatota archaeon]